MYVPANFRIDDENVIFDLIERHSFATVISNDAGLPFASHLPLTLDRDNGLLYGHFARPNPQWNDIEGQNVLAIFHGPHCYISPSWYETTKSVPTWNYVTVHVYGRIEWLNKNELFDALAVMVGKYEAADSSYKMEDSAEYIDALSKGIVGFKLSISSIQAKAKLSQNHSKERQQLVIEQLQKQSDEDCRQIALLMKENLIG